MLACSGEPVEERIDEIVADIDDTDAIPLEVFEAAIDARSVHG